MTKEECEIETSKAIMEMRNLIAELEKENAQLKRKIQEWSNNGYFGRICEFYVGENK